VSGEPGSAPLPGRWSVTSVARSRAPVEAVWPLIAEARRWQEWTFLDRTELLEEGDPAPDGVGALRRFTRFGFGSSERVLAWDPPHHLAYTIVRGFPVRNYRADVTCTPDEPGTLVSWSASFDVLVPGTGHLMVLVVKRLIRGFANSAARHAEGLVEG
jgi:uncharacterized protein YndB with AHSA1/START domain